MPSQERGGSLTYITPLISDGIYLLAFSHYETVYQFRSYKLVLHFRVVTPGPALGAHLCRYYAVRSVATKSRQKGGQFKVGQKSDFYREFCRVFGAPARPDRITPMSYRNTVVLGEVVTVTRGHDQQSIPEGAQYSKVSRLLRLEAGKG
jgi:hypothetical protein